MGLVLLFLVNAERMHPVAHGLIWNHPQAELLQDKLRTLGKNSSIFFMDEGSIPWQTAQVDV